ncbi:hypothetical protein D3C72_1761490 [compost metagenome]
MAMPKSISISMRWPELRMRFMTVAMISLLTCCRSNWRRCSVVRSTATCLKLLTRSAALCRPRITSADALLASSM